MYTKNNTVQPIGIYSRYVSLGQYMKISLCNPSQQTKKTR